MTREPLHASVKTLAQKLSEAHNGNVCSDDAASAIAAFVDSRIEASRLTALESAGKPAPAPSRPVVVLRDGQVWKAWRARPGEDIHGLSCGDAEGCKMHYNSLGNATPCPYGKFAGPDGDSITLGRVQELLAQWGFTVRDETGGANGERFGCHIHEDPTEGRGIYVSDTKGECYLNHRGAWTHGVVSDSFWPTESAARAALAKAPPPPGFEERGVTKSELVLALIKDNPETLLSTDWAKVADAILTKYRLTPVSQEPHP